MQEVISSLLDNARTEYFNGNYNKALSLYKEARSNINNIINARSYHGLAIGSTVGLIFGGLGGLFLGSILGQLAENQLKVQINSNSWTGILLEEAEEGIRVIENR